MTSATPHEPGATPPDPVAFDSPRAKGARRRGLSSPYIPGGRDPDPERGRREERYWLRILIVVVIATVLGGFVLGILGTIFGS